MVIKLDHRHKRFDGDLLLTTACPVECDFCVYSCSLKGNWMPEGTIHRVAREYSENDFGIRICGGEAFLDKNRLGRCIDILLEYYEAHELLAITSGFWGKSKKNAEENINILKRGGVDTLVVSYDRFHATRIPLVSLRNILDTASDSNIEIVLRISLDSKSYSLIDSLAELIVEYECPMEIHDWSPLGRGERVESTGLGEFLKQRDYFFSKIREIASKVGAPPDPLYYLTMSNKRSQIRFASNHFFPTTFPNGNIYACSLTMRGSFMGNINRTPLRRMLDNWKKSLGGSFVLSGSSCQRFLDFKSPRENHRCDLCRNQPLYEMKSIGSEYVGRSYITAGSDDLDGLPKNSDTHERLISIDLSQRGLNLETGGRILGSLDRLREANVGFLISRPIPQCMIENRYQKRFAEYGIPKNCFECNELFTVEDRFLRLCPNVYDIHGPKFELFDDRKDIMRYFSRLKSEFEPAEMCKKCAYFTRGDCDGLCFRAIPRKKPQKNVRIGSQLDMAWQTNPILKRNDRLHQYVETEKMIDAIASRQEHEGWISMFSPMFTDIYIGVELSSLVDRKIKKEVISYLHALDNGKCGFSEMPGETAWIDRTYHVIKCFERLGIKPRMRREMVEFYEKLQYRDGGFNNIGGNRPDWESTYQCVSILSSLGGRPVHKRKLLRWGRQKLSTSSLKMLKEYGDMLQMLGVRPTEEFKETVMKRVHDVDIQTLSIAELYYMVRLQKLVGEENQDAARIAYDRLQRIVYDVGKNPWDLIYLIRTLKEGGLDVPYKEEISGYVGLNETADNLFLFDKNPSIYRSNCLLHSLNIMGGLNRIKRDRYVNWLEVSAIDSEWGSQPKTRTHWNHYSTSSLMCLRLLGTDLNKYRRDYDKKIPIKLEEGLKNIDNDYVFMRLVHDLLEAALALEIRIRQELLEDIGEKMMLSYKEGYFGSDNCPNLYTTYLAVKSLELMRSFESVTWKPSFLEDETVNDIIGFTMSCQNHDGGYGMAPGSVSNVQSTFFALEILHLLRKKPEKIGGTFRWLKSKINRFGVISSAENVPPDGLINYYVIASLALVLRFMEE